MLNKFQELEPSKKRLIIILITVSTSLIFVMLVALVRMAGTTGEEYIPVIEKNKKYGEEDAILADKYRKEAEIQKIKKEKEELLKQLQDLQNIHSSATSKNDKNYSHNTQQDPNDIITGYPIPPNYNIPEIPETYPAQYIEPIRTFYGINSYETISSEARQEPKNKVKTNFLPATSVLKAVLLNGVYAPTRASGKSSPYPVILRIYDLAIFPNDMKKDLKGCQLLGEAHGELQESRAHIRITKLVCVSRDGMRVLEKDMEGWVTGEDGKVGIAGVIEDNFGMLLSKTFLAQTIAGLGEAIDSSKQIIKTDAMGGIHKYTRDDVKDMTASAVGQGLSESFKMIANFMMDLLRDQSPVVRINAQRDVDVIVRNGIELTMDDMHWTGVVESSSTDMQTILMELKGVN